MALSYQQKIKLSDEWLQALAEVQALHSKLYKAKLLRKRLTLTAGLKTVK